MAAGGMQRQTVEITFDKGIDESQSATLLPPGFLTTLTNWTPDPVGGMRPRWAWVQGPEGKDSGDDSDTPYPSTFKVRAVEFASITDGGNDNPGGIWWVVALIIGRDDVDYAQVWATRANFGQDWFFIYEFDADVGIEFYPLAMATTGKKGTDGGAMLLLSHPKVDNMLSWNGSVPSPTLGTLDDVARGNALTQARPGRALGAYKGRVFTGGSDPALDNVTYRAYFSDDGDVSSWPDNNYIDIGKPDATPIVCMQQFQNVLLIGKPSGVFTLVGDDLDTFTVQKLEQTSCAKGRAIVPTPAGAMFLGDSDVWFWDGGDPKRIGQPIATSYQLGAGHARFGAYVAGKVIVTSHEPTCPTFVFDLDSRTWATETLGSTDDDLAAVASNGSRVAGGPYASTILGPLVYRDQPFGARAKDPFDTLAEPYSARTGDHWLTAIRQPVLIRTVYVRTRRYGALGDAVPALSVYVDGERVATHDIKVSLVDDGVEHDKIEFPGGQTGRSIGFGFDHTPDYAGGAVYGIEQALVDIDVDIER